MSFPTRSLDAIQSTARGYFRTAFRGLPLGVRQFLGQTARAVALNVWGLQKSVEQLDQDIVPQPSSSDDALTAWAVTLGLPDGAGGYGRLKPTTASGGAASLTGAGGTVFTSGLTATAEDGVTTISLSGSVTVPGTSGNVGSIVGSFVAVTAGTAGNLPAGTVCTWTAAPVGADPTFTLTSPLSGGADSETNPAVYARIVQRLQTPPRGGVAEDYRIWLQQAQVGAQGVWVYPKRSGVGTVDVAFTLGGSGTARVPSSGAVTTAQSYVDTKRPVGAAAVTVYAPTKASVGHLVRVRVVPNTLGGLPNAFDWQDGGTALVVNAYTAPSGGSPATIQFTGLAPASLKNAVAGYIAKTNPQPRLQVLSTGAPAINVPVGTSPTITWSDSAGMTTVTLDTLPVGWVAPTAGDQIYAYGPVVPTIAAGLLAFVDSLGPSTASGTADPLAGWNDTIQVSQLVAIAQDAIDSAGNKLIIEVPASGATIDGVAADVEGVDTVVAAPELLYASHVAVTA